MAIIGGFQSTDLIISHCEINGRAIMSNGLEAMQKYNPLTGVVLPLVLRPFRQDIVLAVGAAGALTGNYEYRIVPYNINEDEEGEAYPGAEEEADFRIEGLVAQSVDIDLTMLEADNPEITHVRVYRTVAGGVWPTMALVAEEELPVGAVINDNIPDGDLDFVEEPLNVLVKVPVPKPFLCVHGNRVFGIGDVPYSLGQATVTNGDAEALPAGEAAFGFHFIGKTLHIEGDNRVYDIDGYDPDTGALILRQEYTGVTGTHDFRICGNSDELIYTEPADGGWSNPETMWPGTNNVYINSREADKASGILSTAARLIICKSTKTYCLYFDNIPAVPYSRLSLLSSQYGCISHRTMKVIEGVPVWAAKQGVVQALEGVQLVSRDLGDYFRDVLRLDNNGTQQMAVAVDYQPNGQYMLFVPDANAEIGCNRAFVWHYLHRKWSEFRFDSEFTSANAVKAPSGRQIIVLGDRWGYIWEYPFGTADGAPCGATTEGTVDTYEYFPASPTTVIVTDLDAEFSVYGLGLAGVPIYIYEGTGVGQVGIVAGNTETSLFLERPFPIPLDETSRYYLGRIPAQYKTGWLDFGTLARAKRFMYANLAFERQESDLRLNVYGDFGDEPESLVDRNPRAAAPIDHGIVDMSGDDEDSKNPRGRRRVSLGGVRRTHVALELLDGKPCNPWSIYDLAVDFEYKEP